MHYKLCTILTAALLLLAACSGERHERMQQELAALQTANQTDSVLTDDSLAQALADYFDRHGTPNEQMEAHYLLGRTHADRGEAPAALAAYHDAIDRADTTAADCNYRQLCRIYAQMSDIFYHQNLMEDDLHALNKSLYYAFLSGDSTAALYCYAYKMEVFDRLKQPDSVISICDRIYKDVYLKGQRRISAQLFGMAIGCYLEKQDYTMVRKLMEAYENETGYFDSCHNIEKGKEAYYALRGQYHTAVHEYDSAFFYFRKELEQGHNFNNQNAAAKGLSQLYELEGKYDSAAKYALYSYDMNDSLYAQMAMNEVENVNSMYNYNRHQQQAFRESKRAERANNRFVLLLFFALTLFIVMSFALWCLWEEVKRRRKRNAELGERLRRVKEELQCLKKSEDGNLDMLVKEKEREVMRLKALLPLDITGQNAKGNQELALQSSPSYHGFLQFVRSGQKMTEKEWKAVNRMNMDYLPEFHRFMSLYKDMLNYQEYKICTLLRLHIRTKEAAYLMGVDPSYISKVSRHIMDKLWKTKGSSKELRKLLEKLI